MIVIPPAKRIRAISSSKQSLQIVIMTKAKRMRTRLKRSWFSKTCFSQGKNDSDMLILTLNLQQSLARRKIFSDTSNNLIGNNAESGSLSDDNSVDGNVDIDTEMKSNLDDNMTGKNDDDFCKDDLIFNIKDLFQQVQD